MELSKKFDIFVIDPPWPKKKGGLRRVRPNQEKNLDYKTLSVNEIFDLLDKDIFPLANVNHSVFLWGIDEFLHIGELSMENRGYRRHARLIWDKCNGIAPSFSVRYSHEYLTWFYKPKFQPVDINARGKITTVFKEAARQHSRKPDIAYQNINFWYPNSIKLDVFSREKRDGWNQWGNQVDFFDEIKD